MSCSKAKTGDNYERVKESLVKLQAAHQLTPKLAAQIAKVGDASKEHTAKRAAIVLMAESGLTEDQISDTLIEAIANIDKQDEQKKFIAKYQNCTPARQDNVTFFARARQRPLKPAVFHSMLVGLDDDPNKPAAGYSFRQLCQTSTEPDLAQAQSYFDIQRRQIKTGAGPAAAFTEHEISDPLPNPKDQTISALVMHLPDGGNSRVVLSADKLSQLELQSERYDENTAQKFIELLKHVLGGTHKRLCFKQEDLLNSKLTVKIDLGGPKPNEVPFVVLLILIAYKQGCPWFRIGDDLHDFVPGDSSADDKCLTFLTKKLEKPHGWTPDLREKLMDAAEDFVNDPDARQLRHP